MDINIFGYKFRIEILIIIVLVWWLLWGHVICGCSNVTMPQALEAFTSIAREGYDMINGSTSIFAPYRNKWGV
jgi:hypothetical protein